MTTKTRCPEAVNQYFRLLFDFRKERLDKKGIIKALEDGAPINWRSPFSTVAGEFQLIESDMISIIISRDEECEALLEEAKWRGPSRQLSRALQRYTISIYRNEYAELIQRGALESVGEQYLVLRDPKFYDEETGFTIPQFSPRYGSHFLERVRLWPTGVRLKVWGEYVLFLPSRMKTERVSYDVITPSAARGILEAIHWKPAIRWVVDRVKVLNEIRFDNIRRNEVGSKIPR